MNKCNFFLSLLLITTSYSLLEGKATSQHARYLDIAAMRHEQYQDIIINNKVVKKATHNHTACDQRYHVIKRILSRYKRPFTMLDIGASQGYYSFRTGHDFKNAVCVMIEANNPHYKLIGSQLQDLCAANTKLNNIILLNKVVVADDLAILGECEHFDVVLALNIIHWIDKDWKKATDTILHLGYDVIIETPPQEPGMPAETNTSRKEIEDYLLYRGAEIIAEVPRHTSSEMAKIFLYRCNKYFLERKTCLVPLHQDSNHEIICTYKKKELKKPLYGTQNTYITSEWLPGINLLTFKMYHGTWPMKNCIMKALTDLKKVKHNDWTINNMVIQGKKIVMIDHNDPKHNPGAIGGTRRCTHSVFAKHRNLINFDDPTAVKEYFWKHLILESREKKAKPNPTKDTASKAN